MNQNYISRTALLAIAAWSVAAAVLLGAWVLVIALGEDIPPGLIGAMVLSGIIATGVAMLAQIRIYTIRVCSLIRATAGLEHEELRAVR